MNIQDNKNQFCDLLKEVKREGAQIERLIGKLESSDFFKAPASTVYHNAIAGGLCAHCLNVYKELDMLVKSHELAIPQDTIIIVALLHDISKMDYYEPTVVNKKVYSAAGKKYDEMGNFDWVSTPGYKVREANSRILFGTHEETAEFITRCFIPLTMEESVAIIHHSGFAGRPTNYDLTTIFNNYSLALLLHLADMLATYLDERL